jgi:hypothetical protein
MPKSTRTLIIEAVEAGLSKIKAGNPIPNLGGDRRFLSTVRSVNRSMFGVADDKFPALFVVDPVETSRHLLADVLQQTIQLTVAGEVKVSKRDTGRNPVQNAVQQLDNLVDDTRAVLVSDPTWGGLSRRTRLPRLEADTSTDDESLAFAALCEIDYIEAVDTGAGTVVLVPDAQVVDPLSGPYTQPYGETVMNALFNAYLTIPGLKWVERAKNWPLQLEQVSARYTPGVWFHETNENYEYDGSTDTKKRVFVTTVLLAVDTSLDTFPASIDTWVAALKNCLGTYADLGGRVLTVDILAIRTEHSEFPVVNIELDLQIMYVQSFLAN